MASRSHSLAARAAHQPLLPGPAPPACEKAEAGGLGRGPVRAQGQFAGWKRPAARHAFPCCLGMVAACLALALLLAVRLTLDTPHEETCRGICRVHQPMDSELLISQLREHVQQRGVAEGEV